MSADDTTWQEDSHGASRAADSPPPVDRSVPYPCLIRIWLPDDLYRLYDAIDRDLSARVEGGLEPWESLFLILQHLLAEWDRPGRTAYSRQRTILERDGYRCSVPGCRARRTLEVHHIVFRSQGGSDDPSNRITLCAAHHRDALHDAGGLHCRGSALGEIQWTLGRTRYHGDVWRGVA